MKNILLAGAGRSASVLIQYLLENAASEGWQVTIADINKGAVTHSERRVVFDVNNQLERASEVARADLVISLLPPFLHALMARECIIYKKHLLTASYVSPEIMELDAAARAAGVLFLNEMGLDPGIDHMSAMAMIAEIKEKGGKILSYKSYTGGLIAPESCDNPWSYKFTWNPRNVVLAGQATARYLSHNTIRHVPYNRIFKNANLIEIEAIGSLEGYPNRDSLLYKSIYGLDCVEGLLRGTLRPPGFCTAWNVFAQLGLTDDSFKINTTGFSYKDLVNSFLPEGAGSTKERLAVFACTSVDGALMDKIQWTGILSDAIIPFEEASPAMVLQDLLEKKWALNPSDKDRIVMHHEMDYILSGKLFRKISNLLVTGSDAVYTAMAKTVGLPLGIAAKLILNNTIQLSGVQIPVMKEIYLPVLADLKLQGIQFEEKDAPL